MGALQAALASTPATANVTVQRDATGSLIVTGTVPDRITAELVLSKVNALGGPYLSTTGKVIDRLQTGTTSQVDVKVYVLEIDETGLRNLGVLLQAATTTTTVPWLWIIVGAIVVIAIIGVVAAGNRRDTTATRIVS